MKLDLNKGEWPPDRDKAKHILHGLIQESGGIFDGAVRLYKAFVYAHLHHWTHYNGTLTRYPIVKMPNGPGLEQGDRLLREMEAEGMIRQDKIPVLNLPKPRHRYYLVSQVNLSDAEKDCIVHGLAAVAGKTGRRVSDESHKRSWKLAELGERQDIYLDLLDDREFEKIQQSAKEADKLLDGVFGTNAIRQTG